MRDKLIRTYETYSDDFHQNDKSYKLSDEYKWIRTDFIYKFLSVVTYALALIFSSVYCKLFLGLRVVNRTDLKRMNKEQGCFIYGNHTHSIGDVFNPALICFPKRIYTVVNSVNFALPFIGKLLPYLGALPIPDSIGCMKEFSSAVEKRYYNGNAVVIYPEAHLWDYYTGIRPFDSTSFRYPAKLNAPVFSMTVTYQKRHLLNKPRMTIYVDGPFECEGTVREKSESLRKQVYETMVERSRNSNYNYIEYKKK